MSEAALPRFRRLADGRARGGRVILLGTAFTIGMLLIIPSLFVLAISLTGESYIEFPPSSLSLRWYRAFFEDPQWMQSALLSLRIALGATVAATVIGTMAALAFVRGTLPGGEIIRVVSLSPLIVPSIVTAVGMYMIFAPLGLVGNYFGFVIAHTILAVPYVVLVMTASLEGVEMDIELAALSCGASRTRAFFEIILPNILPGAISSAVFAFLSSFDEVTIAIFLSSVRQQTLPSKLFENINYTLTPVIAAASAVVMLLSLGLMLLVVVLNRSLTGRVEKKLG
ncbi:MAG: ABC transporter permease [Rhizobiaceae bacterium]